MIIRESDRVNSAIVHFMQKKLSGQYTFRIPLDLEQELERIALAERRKRSDIARFLLERGLAAYLRDRDLFEPEPLTPKGKAAPESGKKESARAS